METKKRKMTSFGSNNKSNACETITPHKLTVLVYIKEFCVLKEKARTSMQLDSDSQLLLSPKSRKDFCLLCVKLVQGEDLPLRDTINLIHSTDLPSDIFSKILQEVRKLATEGIIANMDLMKNLESLLVDPSPTQPLVSRNSIIGLYIRRLFLAFDKLSFERVISIYECYKEYFGIDSSYINSFDCNYSSSLSDPAMKFNAVPLGLGEPSSPSSRRQAEYFLGVQAGLLNADETKALPPRVLQSSLKKLLTCPQLSHHVQFLSHVNCLRVKEYLGSLHSLYHSFDWSPNNGLSDFSCPPSGKQLIPDDPSRPYRYASLCLAALHSVFGHNELARCALEDAITMALEANDNVCLQHALARMYRLETKDKLLRVSRSIMRCKDLNLYYLNSLGILTCCRLLDDQGGRPSKIFEFLSACDIRNCQHSMLELMCTSYAVKSALWKMYGLRNMELLTSQLLLHMNTCDPSRGQLVFSGESTCLAGCSVANSLAQQGYYSEAYLVLDHLKRQFPWPNSNFKIWNCCLLTLKIQSSLYSGNWEECKHHITSLASLDPWDSKYWHAVLLLHERNLETSLQVVDNLIRITATKSDLKNYKRVLLVILRGTIFNAGEQNQTAMLFFVDALIACQNLYFHYLEAFTLLHIAQAQICLGFYSKALELIKSCNLTMLTNASVYDLSKFHFLWARCVLSSSNGKPEKEREVLLMDAIKLLKQSYDGFHRLGAEFKARDVVYLMAIVYNELGLHKERNHYSKLMKNLDMKLPPGSACVLRMF